MFVTRIVPAADVLYKDIEKENGALPNNAKPVFSGELRLLRTIQHIIIQEMANKLQPATEL